jgi:hypothetical protein
LYGRGWRAGQAGQARPGQTGPGHNRSCMGVPQEPARPLAITRVTRVPAHLRVPNLRVFFFFLINKLWGR